jgi:RimJ/RimL family protein N-acetyltransferase
VPAAPWPFFDLRINTGRLELRPDWDEGLHALAELAASGIHEPDTMPFTEPWSDAPPGVLERTVLQWHWRQRAALSPDAWQLCFLVCLNGRVVGTQGVSATQFSKTRVVSTGSWLGRAYQGQGIGTEMRAAVLHFAFACLGAQRAESGAFHDNAASLGVSAALGYVANGEEIKLRRSEPDRLISLLLTRDAWEAHRWPTPVTVSALEPCLPLLVTPA